MSGGDPEIRGICEDSRRIQPGDLFVCVAGRREDGHRYAAEAVRAGAAAILVEKPVNLPSAAAIARTASVRKILGPLAARFYGNPTARLRLAGVTGTNGKTTVAWLLESIFRSAGWSPALLGTIEYRHPKSAVPAPQTTPSPVFLQKFLSEALAAGCRAAAMEVSSHALDQDRTAGCEWDAAIFTNLSSDHLDYHGTPENYAAAKRKLFEAIQAQASKPGRCAVFWAEDPRAEYFMSACPGVKRVTYGARTGDWRLAAASPTSDGSSLEIGSPQGVFSVRLRLLGPWNALNALAAAAAASEMGVPLPAIREGLEKVSSVPGRMEPVEEGQPFRVLVDYAHTEDALAKALEACRSLTKGKLIVVFGCGGDRDRTKRPRMGEAAARLADFAVLTSDNPRTEDPERILDEVEAGLKAGGGREYLREKDRARAIEAAMKIAGPGDLVLVAGKGHEAYQIVGAHRLPFDDREVCRQALRAAAGQRPGRSPSS